MSTGSLLAHLPAWQGLPASEWVLSVVKSGFCLPWNQDPAPLSACPIFLPPPSSLLAAQALEGEVLSLLRKEAVEELQAPYSPGFYGRIFVVPKATGGWRPVLDLSPLNRFLRRIRFRMETAVSVREAIQSGDWAASLDLRDAYFHVLIHPRFRRWLRFTWNRRVFQFRALPFGLSLSPWVFTRVTRELALSLRARGVRLRMYLDDWLILAQSRDACSVQTQSVLAEATELGFVLNLEKSELSPSQQFNYLGMAFDTSTMLVRPGAKRLARLSQSLQRLRALPSASARQITALLGSMESLSALVPLGRLYKRPLQRQLASRWSHPQGWDVQVQLGLWFVDATAQWVDQSWLTLGVPIVQSRRLWNCTPTHRLTAGELMSTS